MVATFNLSIFNNFSTGSCAASLRGRPARLANKIGKWNLRLYAAVAPKHPSSSQRRRARPGGAREQKFSTSASAPRLFSFFVELQKSLQTVNPRSQKTLTSKVLPATLRRNSARLGLAERGVTKSEKGRRGKLGRQICHRR